MSHTACHSQAVICIQGLTNELASVLGIRPLSLLALSYLTRDVFTAQECLLADVSCELSRILAHRVNLKCALASISMHWRLELIGVVQKMFFRGNTVKGHGLIGCETKTLEDLHPSFEPGPVFPFFGYAVKDEIQKSQQ
ncbi:MAG: hypothetical protein ACOYNF_17245 [Rhodoferax sp.]